LKRKQLLDYFVTSNMGIIVLVTTNNSNNTLL
jgi:hypothetical protein